MNPRVTVLMPVYNAEKYLRPAMDSILGQSFEDFEFLIIDDQSADSSLDIIRGYGDTRVKVVSEVHRGVAGTLNRGLALAQGEYIARMDSDDISLPERLSKQVRYMDEHPEIDVCGSWVEMFNDDGFSRASRYACSDQDIKAELIFGNPIAHPSIIIRKNSLERNGLSYPADKAEDYALWAKSIDLLHFANLPEVLLRYRVGSGLTFNDLKDDIIESSIKTRRQLLERIFSQTLVEEDMALHDQIAMLTFAPSVEFLEKVLRWFKRIVVKNRTYAFFSDKSLRRVLFKYWFMIIARYRKTFMLGHLKFLLLSLLFFCRLDMSAKKEYVTKFFVRSV